VGLVLPALALASAAVLTADPRVVALYDFPSAAHLAFKAWLLNRETQTVEHEPRGLVGDSHHAAEL